MNQRTTHPQQGAATLLLVLGLVLLATLASAWSSRAVLVDLLTSQTRGQALQAAAASQAALATAEADVLQAFGASGAQDLFADTALRMPCPADLPGQRWQCARLPLVGGPVLGDWQLNAWAARDLVGSPHVWQLRASARATSGRGQALVRESLFAPVIAPAPTNTPAGALLLNGCFSAASGSLWQVCPLTDSTQQACTGSSTTPAVYSHFVPDRDGDGTLSAAERSSCLALTPANLPGGGTLQSLPAPRSRKPCNRAVWQSVLGDTTASQLKAWSDAQAANGLHTLSQPARSIYWVDSAADWNQSLGSPQAPVLLVFSSQACATRCPRIAAGVQIHGTVLVDAGCDDEKLRGWQAGTIDGLLAIEGGLPAVTGNGLVRARSYSRQAFSLPWPPGIDARQVQRVAGSHREGAP